MLICGWNKTTLLDYPEHVAATLFTGGCNFRCPFCHNRDLVTGQAAGNEIQKEQVWRFLKKRKGILQAPILFILIPLPCILTPFCRHPSGSAVHKITDIQKCLWDTDTFTPIILILHERNRIFCLLHAFCFSKIAKNIFFAGRKDSRQGFRTIYHPIFPGYG